jgi:rhamnosyltransferase
VYDRILLYYHDVERIYVVDNTEKKFFNSALFDSIKKLEKVSYIANYDNYGIAKALNQAVGAAQKDGFEYILTMDQDSVVEEKHIEKLFAIVRKNGLDLSKIGIISPFHKTHSGCVNTETEEITDKLMVMTSGNLLNIDAYNKIGGFWEELFIDRVDHEYCLRLSINKYRVVQVNTVFLEHPVGKMTEHVLFHKTYFATNHPPIRRYYISRNALHVAKRYKNAFPEYSEFEKKLFFHDIKRIVFFESDKIKKIQMIIKGYNDFRKNIYGKFEIKPTSLAKK